MCLVCQTQLDAERKSAFEARFLRLMNDSALSLMLSLGYRAGLFETMAKLPSAASSHTIAQAAGLNERYTREWLGAMAVSGIVDVDDEGQLFHLPASHAALLADNGDGECLAHLTQYLGVLGSVEDQVLECFHRGGGVPYSNFPRFHEVMAQDSRQSVLGALFDHILPLEPSVDPLLRQGIDALDVGCGRGYALRALAAEYPKSRFVGYDLSEEAIAFAQAESERLELNNLRFEVLDLTSFDQDAELDAFDLVTAFDAIHDQARPDRALVGIRKTLRPDGLFLMQEIAASSNIARNRDHPLGPLIYSLSCMHCMTVSLAQGGIGVGAAWGVELATDFLRRAGFVSISRHSLEHDLLNDYYLCR